MQDSTRLAKSLLLGEIYLGPALAAMQGTMRHQFFLPTAKIVSKRFNGPIRILEIGSWAGASTITWVKAFVELGCPVTIDCVDQWQPYFDLSRETADNYRQMNEAAASKEIYALFQHNLRAAGINDHVTVCYGSSNEVLPKLDEKSYHLIYIDGSHLYQDVLLDIREAKRLVQNGGVICGDDLEVQANELPAQELLQSVKSGLDSASSRSVEQLFHPGVTAAVADELGSVSSWDGYWAISWNYGKAEKIILDLAAAKLPPHIQREYDEILIRESRTPKLIDVFEDFNLVSFQHQIFGIHQTFGPLNFTDLTEQELHELIENYICFTGETFSEVKAKISGAREIISAKTNAPNLIGEFKKFNLISFKKQFFGVLQSVGPLNLSNLSEAGISEMRRNGTCIAEKSLSDVLTKILSVSETLSLEGSTPKRIGEFEGFNLISFNNRYLGMHQSLGAMNLADLSESEIHEMEKNGTYVTGKSLSEVKVEILNTLRISNFKSNSPKHIIELEGFNLVSFNDRFLGIHQSLGPTNLADLSESEIHEMKKSGTCITGRTLSDVITKILSNPKSPKFEDSAPKCIGEFEGFNLVFFNNLFFGIHQSFGPTNLADLGQLAIDEMKKNGICVIGKTAFDVKKDILRQLAPSKRAT